MKNLCMAGGVALNCVANGRLYQEKIFENIFVQPAAGDNGGALGAAYYVYNTILSNERNYIMKTALLGPEFSNEEIENVAIDSDYESKYYLDSNFIQVKKEKNYMDSFLSKKRKN